jgi:hypothetical protein
MKGKMLGTVAAIILLALAMGPLPGCMVDADGAHGGAGVSVGVGVHAGVDVNVGIDVDVDTDPCGFDIIIDVDRGGLCCDTDSDGCCDACPDDCGAL